MGFEFEATRWKERTNPQGHAHSLLYGQSRKIEIGSDRKVLEVTMINVGREPPGLVVMGGDSCSNGRGFKSQHCILDVHFFIFICGKNCNVCLKIRK